MLENNIKKKEQIFLITEVIKRLFERMVRKNCIDPSNVIDRNNGIYFVYRTNGNGKYSLNGTPKNKKQIMPFIDSRKYDGITIRAKQSLLESIPSGKITRRIKKLTVVDLSKLI